MRKVGVLFILVSALIISSCVNTDVFVSDLTFSEDLSVDEKLIALGATRLDVNKPEAFYDGDEWLDRLMELTRECDDYILISTFLGSSSEALEPFYELLCQKAESGVDVYMIIDGISSYDMTESRYHMTPLYFLRDRGVHLIEYSPVSAMHLIAPNTLMIRDHRKLFVFDGRACAIGGMNINYISMGAGDENQRDSMYLFSSKELCSALTDEFVSIWNGVSVEKIDRASFSSYLDERKGDVAAYLFNQGPGGESRVSNLYATLINSAKEDISMIAFLPVFDDNMLAALKAAKERGVHIKILASVEDRALGGVSYILPDLVAVADEFYLSMDSKGRLLHEKLFITDNRYTVIGSTNFNYRSMGLSNEIALMLDSSSFASSSNAHIDDRISDGVDVIDLKKAEERKNDDGSFLSYLMVYYGG